MSQYPSGLTNYWPIVATFPSSISSIVDCVSSMNGLSSGTTTYTTDRNALTSDALNLNNGYATLTSSTYFSSAFTITAWVKAGSTLGSWCRLYDFGVVSASPSPVVSNIFLALSYSTTNQLSFRMTNSTNTLKVTLDTSYTLSTTSWSFVGITYDGYTATIYIYNTANTLLYTSSVTSSTYWIPNNVVRTSYLGKSFYSADGTTNSLLDQLAVYNRDLTSTQISTIASISYGTTGPNWFIFKCFYLTFNFE